MSTVVTELMADIENNIAQHQRTWSATERSGLPQPADTKYLLENGARLSRAEFERRYEEMPHIKKAELIEGVVYMPSPVRIEHSQAQADILGWLTLYRVATPGIQCGDNVTLRLDADNEVQPDVFLRLMASAGGASRISDDHYLEGAPELIVEVAASSASYDLHDKKHIYRRNGVQEYIVWRVYDRAVDWFHLHEGAYVRLAAGEDGLLHSQVFPGLQLDVDALLAGNLPAVLAAVSVGTKTDAHAAFVASIEAQVMKRGA